MTQEQKKFKLTRWGLTLSILGITAGVSGAAFLATNFNNTPVIESSQEIVIESTEVAPEPASEEPNIAAPVVVEEIVVVEEEEAPIMPESTTTEISVVSPIQNTKPSTTQEITNDSEKVTASPNPAKKETPEPVKPVPTSTQSPSEENLKYCPNKREENPELYDSCREGFVAPTFEFAGYHSCKRVTKDTFQITGLVRMVGGNYKDFAWNEHTYKGMALVSTTFWDSDPSFPLSWFVKASFRSMNPSYEGLISKEGDNGINWIDESLIPSKCLSR
jgi:hypothetical protein